MNVVPNSHEPAFPLADAPYTRGLTKREHIATQILSGLMAAPDQRTCSEISPEKIIEWRRTMALEDAVVACIYADALLTVLDKSQNTTTHPSQPHD